MSRTLSQLAGIDLRSLSAFRIGLGLLVALDQGVALTDARVFYSDAGMLPRSLLYERFASSPWIWSLHTLSGGVGWQVVLMIAAILAALAVIAGWHTRLSLLVSWALLCSLQARNPTILYGGDTALRLLCFWGLFLPLDARWSLTHRDAQGRREGVFMSMATVGLLLQVASIYWFTAALKFGHEWTRDGTAVYFVLMNDQFVRGLGHLLLTHPDLCRQLTFGVITLELAGPFIAFIPWHNHYWRIVIILAFWLMHLGLFLCLRLGCFSWIMMVAWVPFIPSWVWDHVLHPKLSSPPPIIKSRSAVAGILAAFCMTVSLLWNLRTVDMAGWKTVMVPWLNSAALGMRLDQHWSMFAPAPTTTDGWLVLDAELADGRHVDLLRGGQPVTFDKPDHLSDEAPDWKWHKLLSNLLFPPWAALRQPFGADFAMQWSKSHPANLQVRSWTLVFMSEETLPHYMAITPQRIELAKSP